jgi:hypothetical protein
MQEMVLPRPTRVTRIMAWAGAKVDIYKAWTPEILQRANRPSRLLPEARFATVDLDGWTSWSPPRTPVGWCSHHALHSKSAGATHALDTAGYG